MPKVSGGSPRIPTAGSTSVSNVKSSAPSSDVQKSKETAPEQPAQKLSEQQKGQRKLEKNVSGAIKKAAFQHSFGKQDQKWVSAKPGGAAAQTQATQNAASEQGQKWVSAKPGASPQAAQTHGTQHAAEQGQKWVSAKPGGSAQAQQAQQPQAVKYNADPKVHAELQKVSSEVNSEIKQLYAKYPRFDGEGKRVVPNPDDKEKIGRYENLANSLKSPDKANTLGKAIAENKDDPLYKHMGATKFTSFVNQSNANLEKSGASTHGMTTMERAAVYGYTTGDYKDINTALRKGGGNISDPGLSAYAQHTKNGMQKLPDYQPPPGQSNNLYRAIFTEPSPGWGQNAFVKGKTYSDHGFASTATSFGQQGSWNLTIQGTKGAKDVGPYSAWPGEKEVLTLPGTKYNVADVQGTKVTLVPQ